MMKILLFLFFTSVCLADITIHKIISVKPKNGSMTVGAVLDDGVEKRMTWLGGLPDDDAAARTAILARRVELWNEGIPWTDAATNIISSKKTFNDNIPDKANVNAANSVPALRVEVARLIDAVNALREMLN